VVNCMLSLCSCDEDPSVQQLVAVVRGLHDVGGHGRTSRDEQRDGQRSARQDLVNL